MLIQVVLVIFAAVLLFIIAGYLWFVSVKESPKAELKRRLRRLAKGGRPGGMPEELRDGDSEGNSSLRQVSFQGFPS